MRSGLALAILVMVVFGLTACKPIPEELRPFYQHDWGNLEASQAVLQQDFPDPDVLKVGDTYYAFATISWNRNAQVASSVDLLNWTILGDALPEVPPWAFKDDVWAPDVSFAPDDQGYQLFFVAKSRANGRMCIGFAESLEPAGPYHSDAQAPLVCQEDEGGSIDPATFIDADGQRYLLWKNDGNCCGFPTWLYIQQFAPDGSSLTGDPSRLLTTSLPWEGTLIEAPTLFRKDGRYYLFYSANAYYDERYAVGVAWSDDLLGPYTKMETPLLSSGMGGSSWVGPGGQDVVIGPDGDTYLAFHGWDKYQIRRMLYIEKLYWQDKLPKMKP